jgi:hypothetical protein
MVSDLFSLTQSINYHIPEHNGMTEMELGAFPSVSLVGQVSFVQEIFKCYNHVCLTKYGFENSATAICTGNIQPKVIICNISKQISVNDCNVDPSQKAKEKNI